MPRLPSGVQLLPGSFGYVWYSSFQLEREFNFGRIPLESCRNRRKWARFQYGALYRIVQRGNAALLQDPQVANTPIAHEIERRDDDGRGLHSCVHIVGMPFLGDQLLD